MKFYKIVAIITLIIFLLLSFFFIHENRIFMSLVVALLGIIFYKGITASVKKKYGKKQTETQIVQKKLPDFHWKEIEGKGLQLLESIHIITNTKNLDILRGRMIFINQIYPSLLSYSSLHRYTMDVQKSIDRYKTIYYDKILTSVQTVLLLKPNIQMMEQLYSDCILTCYARYVEQQNEEISRLKTNAAKERRREDIINKGYIAKYMFKEFDLPDNGYLQKIEDIRKIYYSYRKEIES